MTKRSFTGASFDAKILMKIFRMISFCFYIDNCSIIAKANFFDVVVENISISSPVVGNTIIFLVLILVP